MNRLTNQNIYESPVQRISFFVKKLTRLVFYKKMISVVWKASRLSKKGEYTGQRWIESSLAIVRALEFVGVHLVVENLTAFKDLESPCVFISNHMSTLETFVFPCIIQPYRDITFIVKKGLITYPIFKHIMISRNPVVVTRTDPIKDFKTVLEQGQERLNRNISIVVFPQTTRIVGCEFKRFNSIGVKLAKRAGVPIIPVALRTDAWGNGRLIKDFGKINPEKPVRICFGDPIYIKGNGKKEHEIVVQFIKNKLKSWYQEKE